MDSVSLFSDHDVYLFKEGRHFKLYDKLGSHSMNVDGKEGTFFSVWAPNAERVSLTGDFNGWNPDSCPLAPRNDDSGIWEGFFPGVEQKMTYKYHIVSRYNNYRVDKGDPFAFYWENPPQNASITWDLTYEWGDNEWMANRHWANRMNGPFAIYEVHLGSWRRVPDELNGFLNYRDLAHYLADYSMKMGFTHIELLPIMEHPFYGSWGYQTLGYFAPTSRYGTPQDFMYLIDYLHQNGIGIILDWVPSHFPTDEYGLAYFDGTHLYEHADPKKGYHPDWKSAIFNYGRNEVRAFLVSSAMFWLEKYHVDGIRVDAVASILYLDYGRQGGEWIPNEYGGRENIEAIEFLRTLNKSIYEKHPDVQTFAEESTAWPMVSRPAYAGGLGFGMKWNMGWMHDTLKYFSNDPIFRKFHHDKLTFSIWYAFYENFVLPLSHDEVVHGKGALLGKMPGDENQRCANLKLLFGLMYGHPGKKLLFMGGEIGQWKEWNHEESIEWHVLQYPSHKEIQRWVKDLNFLYTREPALFELDFTREGFEWLDFHDWERSIISFARKGSTTEDIIVFVYNFTPILRHKYRIGVPRGGFWKEVLNSDAEVYGGSGEGNSGGVHAAPIKTHERDYSLSMTIPPLGVLCFKNEL